MRVAVVAEETTHHRESDFTARVGSIADRLTDRGHDVVVFCTQWWEGDHRSFNADGVAYRSVAADRDAGWKFAAGLASMVARFRPEVVHAAATDPLVVHGAKLASVVSRAALVAEWYDVAAEGGRLRRLAARVPDLVVTPSRMVRTEVRELGRPADDIEVIPNGIEMDRIRSVEADPVADVVYSRALDSDANLESLLLALAEYRRRGWSAAVIGDGPRREDYERQARDLRIDDRVTFVGERSLDERLAIFKGAHVYVQTAMRTPFPTDLVRALACGCVGLVEYHAASSAHEFVEREPRGILATTQEELTDAFESAAGLERKEIDEAFAEYDREEVLDRYLECYRGL